MAAKRQCSSPQPTEWVKGKEVGSGSFGTVHLAMDKATGSLFVIKSAESEMGLLSLQNEARILNFLDSPYIVRCIGMDSSVSRNLNLHIEYMAGGSLSDVAEKFGGRLDEKVIRLYTKEILQGLKYLHENGIVHSDLKCKNVLLGSCGNIKLADFGCASQVCYLRHEKSSELSCKSVGGTPLWMAPEVLRKEGLDCSADIWSLGCTVIEMATGKPPWSNDILNPMAAVLKIACGNELPKFPAQFSEHGLDFLAKCLDRNPKKRWTAEELLEHPFVEGSSDDRQSAIGDSCSPTSILDVEMCSESNESDEYSDGDEFIGKVPFSMRSHSKNNEKMFQKSWTNNHEVSSECWMTVRSR